jgi:catechol 2,3-dioxygenase-like lactoylglutathione lyase family enzyme
MIDHIGMKVGDLARSRAFYEKALNPLGYTVVKEFGSNAAGFGAEGKPSFWIGGGRKGSGGVHIAFAAVDRASVDAFYEAALSAGGVDNGKPGVREQYHPHYYGAFVFDPDGNNVEAVCHRPG